MMSLSVKFVVSLAVVIVLLVASFQEAEGRRGKGARRRNKMRKTGTPRFLFYTNPKQKEYYDNPDGATIVKASHFDYEFDLGHKVTFICVATGNPTPRITWFKDGVELMLHPFMQVSEWKLADNKIKSKIEIDPARQMDSGTYECQANNKYTYDRRSFKADFYDREADPTANQRKWSLYSTDNDDGYGYGYLTFIG